MVPMECRYCNELLVSVGEEQMCPIRDGDGRGDLLGFRGVDRLG